MKDLKPREKKKLVARLIELYVHKGIDITPLICKPLSFFDYDMVQQSINDYENEKNDNF